MLGISVSRAPAEGELRIRTSSMVALMSVQRESWRVKEAREFCGSELDDYAIVEIMERTGYDPVKYIPLLVDCERKPGRDHGAAKENNFLTEKATQLRETVTMNAKAKQDMNLSIPDFSEKGMKRAVHWILGSLNETVNYKISMTTSDQKGMKRMLAGYDVQEKGSDQILMDMGPDIKKRLLGTDRQMLCKDWKAFFENEATMMKDFNFSKESMADARAAAVPVSIYGNTYWAHVARGTAIPNQDDVQALLAVKCGIFLQEDPAANSVFSKAQTVSVDDLKNFVNADGMKKRGIEEHLFAWHLAGISPAEMKDQLLAQIGKLSPLGIMKHWCQWLTMFPSDFVSLELPEILFEKKEGETQREQRDRAKWTRLWDIIREFAPRCQETTNVYRVSSTGAGISPVAPIVQQVAEKFADQHARMLRSVSYADIVEFLTGESLTEYEFINKYFTQIQNTVTFIAQSLAGAKDDASYKLLVDFWLDLASIGIHSETMNLELGFEVTLALQEWLIRQESLLLQERRIDKNYRRGDIERLGMLFSQADAYRKLMLTSSPILQGYDRRHIICILPYLLWLSWLKDKIMRSEGVLDVKNVIQALELATVITCGWGVITASEPIDAIHYLQKEGGLERVMNTYVSRLGYRKHR